MMYGIGYGGGFGFFMMFGLFLYLFWLSSECILLFTILQIQM